MSRISPRLTYANVMSTLAVFAVLAGGTAFAAAKLKKNAVKTKNIKNLAVTEPKLGAEAVTNPKIGDKQVKTGKLGEGSVTTAKLDDKAVTAAKTDLASLGIFESGRRTFNPTGATVGDTLIAAGGVTLSASCTTDVGGNPTSVTVDLAGPADSFYSGVQATDGGGGGVEDVASSLPDAVGVPVTAANQRQFTSLTVMTPTGSLHLDILVAANQQSNDCLFAATGKLG